MTDCFKEASQLWDLRTVTEQIRDISILWKPERMPAAIKPRVEILLSRMRDARGKDFITNEQHLKLAETVGRLERALKHNDLNDAIIATNTIDDMLMNATLEGVVRCECAKR